MTDVQIKNSIEKSKETLLKEFNLSLVEVDGSYLEVLTIDREAIYSTGLVSEIITMIKIMRLHRDHCNTFNGNK